MKLVFIFDQIQAGAGGKERADTPLQAKAGPIGSAQMFASIFHKLDIQVIGTMYCGDMYYQENKEEVQRKILGMIKKLNPDAILCGPAFDYEGYAKMAAELTKKIQNTYAIPVISAFSKENKEIINTYKDSIPIVKMPKKGGIGLTQTLENMATLLYKMYKQQDVQSMLEKDCY